MTLGLIGYGRMGKEIERLAAERGWEVRLRLTSRSAPPSRDDLSGIDVGIHFAHPASVPDAVNLWSSFGKNLVIGTTGWSGAMDAVRRTVEKSGTGLIHGANFSPGVHVFAHLVSRAGQMAERFGYDASIHETHHAQKIDSPSGTALMLGRLLLEHMKRKTSLLTGPAHGAIGPDQLQVTSSRTGAVVGTHTVLLDSAADTLELTHRAKNRTGFAQGALMAAEWILTRKGVHTVEEMMAEILNS